MKLDTRFLRVTVLASVVLLIETVFFHVMEFLFEYFVAASVISWAVLGLGLGAWAASRFRKADEDLLFLVTTLATTAAVLLTAVALLRYPALWLVATGISSCFFFPVLYITVMFERHDADRVYLYDMAGAGLGVILTVGLYEVLHSEGIILLTATALPLLGLVVTLRSQGTQLRKRLTTLLVGPLVLVGLGAFMAQAGWDAFNVLFLFDKDSEVYDVRNIFSRVDRSRHEKTYDSLVGRLDVITTTRGKNRRTICYNGYGNDHIEPRVHRTFPWYHERGEVWPTNDPRVFYGLRYQPQFYIVGSAARGITPTAKKITSVDRITPIEINPGILDIMERDFFRQSGGAYKGLDPIRGNALSILKSRGGEYDILTLINTHSGRTVGYPSGPDHLQTRESYHLYFDHLSEDGVVLLEERPFNRQGQLGVYRMLRTFWHTLAERGATDPSAHFMIWDWMGSTVPGSPHIDLRMTESGAYRYAEGYYQGIIVARDPLVGEHRDQALEWFRHAAPRARLLYLDDHVEVGEFRDVFGMIESDDYGPLLEEDWDPSILTSDRPFASLSLNHVPQVDDMLRVAAWLSGVLGSVFLLFTLYKAPPGRASGLSAFNVLIGFGYFFIELIYLQVYQNVFISPSATLVLVLGIMLMSSGVGGAVLGKLKTWQVATLLMPVALVTLYLPGFMLSLGLPSLLQQLVAVVAIAASGLLMGVFFPRGLTLAGRWGMGDRIPALFALNSVAGSFAVVLTLWVGVHHGYSLALLGALVMYLLAAVLLGFMEDRS